MAMMPDVAMDMSGGIKGEDLLSSQNFVTGIDSSLSPTTSASISPTFDLSSLAPPSHDLHLSHPTSQDASNPSSTTPSINSSTNVNGSGPKPKQKRVGLVRHLK